eukprot:2977601-Prorocentrum_lima.AAC.1
MHRGTAHVTGGSPRAFLLPAEQPIAGHLLFHDWIHPGLSTVFLVDFGPELFTLGLSIVKLGNNYVL